MANFLTCARTATRAFISTTTPRHTNQACLWVRVRVRVSVRVQDRSGGPLTEAGNKLTVGVKILYSLVTKPYLIETASDYTGKSEEVASLNAGISGELRLHGQIYTSWDTGCAGCR